MTRKETKEWAESMVKHIFHRHYKAEETINGWVARDENGNLYFYECKPKKRLCMWTVKDSGKSSYLAFCDFPSVKWEDNKPTPVTITIKMK